MDKEKDKQTEKTQTTEKTQVNQNQTPFSFLKGVESKKKEAQAQMVEIQPLGSEAIQANQIKTPGMIPKEIIAINDLENENEKKTKKKRKEKKTKDKKRKRKRKEKKKKRKMKKEMKRKEKK